MSDEDQKYFRAEDVSVLINKFVNFSIEWLDDISIAIDAAISEGAFGNTQMIEAIREEYLARRRDIPLAHGGPMINPHKWNKSI